MHAVQIDDDEVPEEICDGCAFFTRVDCLMMTPEGMLCPDCLDTYETHCELEPHCECHGVCTRCTPGA